MTAVASQRTPGLFYEVREDIDGWRCSCPGFQFRRTCKHIREVVMGFNNANYVPVAERLAEASAEIAAVETETPAMLTDVMGYIRAHVALLDGRKATGTATFRLDLSGKGAQATNPIEDCETSAVGRALAFLGYSSNRSIATREEVQEAQRREPLRAPARPRVTQVEQAPVEVPPEEAERRFYAKYGAVVGGRTWHHVAVYLDRDKEEWRPVTTEDWRKVAAEVIQRQKQNAAEVESIPA